MVHVVTHSPLLSAIARHANNVPDKIAVYYSDVAVTYGMLWKNIVSTASLLLGQGVVPGDRVGLVARKGIDFIYFYFASQLLGATNVVLDPESNPERLAYIKEVARPKIIVGDEPLCDVGDLPSTSLDRFGRPGLTDESPAEIVFTTGTTGAAKGVVLSHGNIFGSAANINSFIGNGRDDVEVLCLPLCHSFGLGRLRCTMLQGATLIILPSFANVKVFFAALEKFHATGFGMVPAAWAYIRKFSGTRIAKYAGQIKYIEIGSAAMPIAQKRELCELFPTTRICHHYGLTEASRAAFMEYHDCIANLKTIGREVSDKVIIKIFNEQGVEVPDGESGELCVKGNMVTKGYLRSEENKCAYWGDYFRTGDGGYRGLDGNLYLVSRIKELINVGGKKVSPVEVEDAIIALGAQDCAVIGIADKRGVLGEVPKAFVVRGVCTLSLEELAEGLRGTLEDYKIPAEWAWIDAVPKTASGKKQRLQLRK